MIFNPNLHLNCEYGGGATRQHLKIFADIDFNLPRLY